MSKKINRDEKYVCTLSAELLEKAKNELNEDPGRREEDIEALRQWMLKQRYINGRTDDAFLLRYLRNGKFSIERAKEKLEKYYTLKTALPEWYTETDISISPLREMLKAGLFVPIGYDHLGRRVVIGRIGNLDPAKYRIETFFKLNQLLAEYVLMDEQTQICGAVFISDMGGMTASHAAQMTPTVAKKAMMTFQDAMPLRMKGGHYINTPAIFDVIFPVMKAFMKSKFLSRVHFHGSKLESLHAEIPAKYLPTEYGGTAGDFSKFIAETEKAVLELRDYFIEEEQYKVDESKRPGKPKTQADLFGIDGTFRKLNID